MYDFSRYSESAKVRIWCEFAANSKEHNIIIKIDHMWTIPSTRVLKMIRCVTAEVDILVYAKINDFPLLMVSQSYSVFQQQRRNHSHPLTECLNTSVDSWNCTQFKQSIKQWINQLVHISINVVCSHPYSRTKLSTQCNDYSPNQSNIS